MLRRIWALMIKEFLALLKDKRSRLVLIVPPVVQLFVFGYAASYDLNHVPYAVLNEDPGSASRDLLARFEGSPTFSLTARLTRASEIGPLIDNGSVLLVLHLYPDFTRNLLSGQPADLQAIVDGRNSNTANLVLSYLSEITTSFNLEWLRQHQGLPPLASLAVRTWFNPNLESRWFFVPGIVALLTLVVTLLVTSLSVAREREAGTFDQLLVTPLQPFEILLGKALPAMIIGTIEASFIMLIAKFWFQIPLAGSLTALYLGLLLFLLSAVGIGLMVSSLAATQQQGLFGAFIFLVPAIILSGFTTPIANMPVIVQKLTFLNPMSYFLVIIRSVFLEGAGLPQLWPQYWPMLIIGLVTLTAAGLFFRHKLY